jgi:hypothetical protein
MSQELIKFVEKRHRPRWIAHAHVYAHIKGQKIHGKCINMSVGGALIKFDQALEVHKNSIIELTFIVRLNNGKLTKLYFKEGIVMHTTNGAIGFSLGNRKVTLAM